MLSNHCLADEMCDNYLIVAVLLGLAGFSHAGSAPFITPCKPGDAACATDSANKALRPFAAGVADLGVEDLTSVHFDKVDASTPNLKFILSDVIITGLENCVILTVEPSESKIHFKLLCSVELNGHYELSGNLLGFNVAGNDKVHVLLRKAEFDLTMDMVTKNGKDGKKHWHVKRFHHKYDLQDKSDVVFENLFEGNQGLGEAASTLIKENGNEVVTGIGGPMIVAAVKRVIEAANKLFFNVPLDELVMQ